MIQSRRLAYAVLSTSDVDKQARYFESVLGLHRAFTDPSRAVLATQHGLECIVLERDGAQPGLKGLAFEIAPKISLDEAKSELERGGIGAAIRPRAHAQHRPRAGVQGSKGNRDRAVQRVPVCRRNLKRIRDQPAKLGHVAYSMPSVDAISQFYIGALGFRKSDWREGAAIFLRCSTDHHTVNFFRGDQKLHHSRSS